MNDKAEIIAQEHKLFGHDFFVPECEICNKPKDESKAHAPKTHSSHAECDHDITKAARAMCRRQNKAEAQALRDLVSEAIGDHYNK